MKKGYGFLPNIDYIKQTMNLSAKEKLIWLEEANEFIRKFVSDDKYETWKRISKGEI